MQKLIAIIAIALTSLNGVPAKKPASPTNDYVWTKLLDNADWKKSYNFRMMNQAGKLWVLHHDGTWSSGDGRIWTKASLPNAVSNMGFLDYVQLKNQVFGLGRFEGNIERFIFRPEIYRTTDMKHWDTLSKHSNLPARFFYHPFAFANKLWIIGGADKNTMYADIWNSTDGIRWTKQKDNLPFGKRQGSQVVSLNGRLFLLNNDVWTSTDGLNWRLVTPEIVKDVQLFGYAAVVFDNKIWLIGCNRNEQFSSQVLYSSDALHWETMNAPWSPRGGVAAAVYKNKIYMTGGKYGGTRNNPDFRYSNDLWVLEKK